MEENGPPSMASNAIFKDADWLLGAEPAPRKTKRYVALFLVSSSFVALFTCWPLASRMIRESQSVAALKEAKNSHEKTAAISSLAELLPSSLPTVVQNLSSTDPDVRRLSYRVLNDYLDKLVTKPEHQRQQETLRISKTLASYQPQATRESQPLVAKLAGRIFASSMSDDSQQGNDIAESAEIVLVAQNQSNALVPTNSGSREISSPSVSRFAEIDHPTVPANPGYSATTIPSVTSILNDYLAFQDLQFRQQAAQYSDCNVPSCQSHLACEANELGQIERFCYGSTAPKTNLMETAYLNTCETPKAAATESSFSKMDTRSVLRFLNDGHTISAREAAVELRRRGMNSKQSI
jgi:hypothetical protein